jgi:S-layer protein Slr4
MNLFKKALVASAIVASFGANATATVSSTPLKLSAEGVAAGNEATNQDLTFDVVVGTLHPAASTITLTFDSTIDLDGLTGGAVTNTPANGTGTAGNVTFDYGTGSFTFDNVVVDDNDQTKGEQDSISFDINLGNPLTASSAFRITLGDTVVDITGAATVAYASETSGGDAIETGSGTVATEVTQFSFATKTAFDGVIDRDDATQFLDATDIDVAVFNYSNNEALGAALAAPTAALKLSASFEDVVAADTVGSTLAATGATNPATPLVGGVTTVDLVNEDEISLALLNANSAVDGTVTEITLTFDNTAGNLNPTGSIEAQMTVDSADLADPLVIATAVAAGEWVVDATIINVPYFPVGYEGTSTSVHFANEGAADVDVIVSAIDADGNEYGPLDMGSDLAGDTVTKVSQTAIMSLFGLTDSAKLSVTFNLDANDGVVNAYAFTSSEVGRTEISNSQLKGK